MVGSLHCVITSPEGSVFNGEGSSVVVTATDGELCILPRHAPLIAALGNGEARVTLGKDGRRARFFIHGGFCQVLNNQVTVLATRVESLESTAKADAEEKLKVLEANPPPVLAPFSEREDWHEKVNAAKRRLMLIR